MLNFRDLQFEEAKSLDLTPFFNTRARVTRKLDESQFAAWVSPNYSGQLQLAMSNLAQIAPGESFEVVLTNSRESVRLFASFIGEMAGRATFKVTEKGAAEAPVEQMRRKEAEITARLVGGGVEAIVSVVDVATRGLGVLVPFAIMPGISMRVVVAGRSGSIPMEGRVVYCKPNEEGEGFRAGFEISRIGENEQMMWDRLVESGR